jgi:glycerophosphoryl diester phosphodiesterase
MLDFLTVILIVLAVLFVLYVLALRGRTNNPNTKKFEGVRFAHRGLWTKDGAPENSIPAFLAAVERGYGIELDVHLTKDKQLVVIHDSSLQRTVGAEGKIEEMTLSELRGYTLLGSDTGIPTLDEVLSLVDGKVPLLIELKCEKNARELCAFAAKRLLEYGGDYCFESFDPRAIKALKKVAPNAVRGQLTQNFIRNRSGLSLALCIVLTVQLCNFISKPDFIAVKFEDRKMLPIKISTNLWGMSGFVWTIKTQNDLEASVKEGFSPIFEGFQAK